MATMDMNQQENVQIAIKPNLYLNSDIETWGMERSEINHGVKNAVAKSKE